MAYQDDSGGLGFRVGCRVPGLGFRVMGFRVQIMENAMEKKMGNEMETGLHPLGFIRVM